MEKQRARLAVDIGGTFTDVALDVAGALTTAKVLTVKGDPVRGVLEAIGTALTAAALAPADVETVIHGTTLATNALIERTGCVVGAILTEGFRDILEIGYERRYDQYDIFLEKPDVLVPRDRCFTVPERVDVFGRVITPLDERAVEPLLDQLDSAGVDAVAVCFLHSYRNGEHERRVAELLAARRPALAISLSSEVSPESREYDRLCTTVANAYITPLMTRYLSDLDAGLRDGGFNCPLLIMNSGGSMTTLETSMRFPIRLVESGPSGGAILASRVAKQAGFDKIVSFDMGGTTAKICLIDDGKPQTSRHFEVARAARFIRGSGFPIRIPVIEMIEIGAGGGSIVSVDAISRITIGPRSAGSEPGPASYGRGGTEATVTDADVAAGYLDPDTFAEGRLRLDIEMARAALDRDVGGPLSLPSEAAAVGVSQVVDETMANAARIHAMERGKTFGDRVLVAFGGNGPLHAAQVAKKLGIRRIVVPPDPGVGSAVGFLDARVSYETVRSLNMLLSDFDVDAVNGLFVAMEREADEIVRAGAHGAERTTRRTAFMRYHGQGHEIEVPVASGILTSSDARALRSEYERQYARVYARHVPDMEIEIMNWAVVVATIEEESAAPETAPLHPRRRPDPEGFRSVQLGATGEPTDVPRFDRRTLLPGDCFPGPALVVEAQATTYVAPEFELAVDAVRNLVLTRSTP
jgi:N-methylhydantoinase A